MDPRIQQEELYILRLLLRDLPSRHWNQKYH